MTRSSNIIKHAYQLKTGTRIFNALVFLHVKSIAQLDSWSLNGKFVYHKWKVENYRRQWMGLGFELGLVSDVVYSISFCLVLCNINTDHDTPD